MADFGAISGSRASTEPVPVSALSGFDPGEAYVPFSVRNRVSQAIADPGLHFPRIRTKDGMVETLSHWQARAAIEAVMQCVGTSRMFAQAIEARRAATVKQGAVHESAVAKGEAPKPETGHSLDRKG